MPRLVYLSGVGLALVALALLLTDALLWRPGVTEANVKRIRAGMTLEEVRALFGDEPEIGLGPDAAKSCRWWGAEGAAWVHFDENQLVTSAQFDRGAEPSQQGRYAGRLRPTPSEPGPFARLRAWLGW
jgi:hypothetical protein